MKEKEEVLFITENKDGTYSMGITTDFISQYGINSKESDFLAYLLKRQIKKGFKEWLIIKFEEVAKDLDVKKVSVQRWFKKFKDADLLIQEDFRSPLWKFNTEVIRYAVEEKEIL